MFTLTRAQRGVLVDLAQMLAMLSGEVTMVKELLYFARSRHNKQVFHLERGATWTLHTETPTYFCVHQMTQVTRFSMPSISWEQAGEGEGQMLPSPAC